MSRILFNENHTCCCRICCVRKLSYSFRYGACGVRTSRQNRGGYNPASHSWTYDTQHTSF